MDEMEERRRGNIDLMVAMARLEEKFDASHKAYRDSERRLEDWQAEFQNALHGSSENPGLIPRLNTLSVESQNHFKSDVRYFSLMITLILAILGWTVFK